MPTSFPLLLTALALAAPPGDPPGDPPLVAKPDAFPTLVNPDCSHCKDEAKRRAGELRDDDRVLCWVRDTKGHYNGGASRSASFSTPTASSATATASSSTTPTPASPRLRAVLRLHLPRLAERRDGHAAKDGTLYSCLTGEAFDGPQKGTRLKPVPTVVSDWGFWLQRYPDSVAYHMFDKYQPVELPREVNEDSKKSRGVLDGRLAADRPVLGVAEGKEAKAYPLDVLEKAGLIEDQIGGGPCVVLWEAATGTAAAYRPVAAPAKKEDGEPRTLTLYRDDQADGKPLTDKETGSHWDVAGRAYEGKLAGWTLTWLDGTQVKWFAWAAEHPDTAVYGRRDGDR